MNAKSVWGLQVDKLNWNTWASVTAVEEKTGFLIIGKPNNPFLVDLTLRIAPLNSLGYPPFGGFCKYILQIFCSGTFARCRQIDSIFIAANA